MTRIKIEHLLQTYFDVLSRIEIRVPILLGVILSSVALLPKVHVSFPCIAVVELVGWVYLYRLFRKNQVRFEKQGYGPIPVGTWVNPPAQVLRPGDLILTSGRIAKALHESVGHAETVIKMTDGQWMLFSSYMDKGTKLHPLSDLTDKKDDGHYVALHLKNPWSEEEETKAAQIAEKMVETDRLWAARENAKLERIVSLLPLPETLKEKLKVLFHASGYDWFGTFMGRVADDHWTCIGACVELYKQMGVRINDYGTGLLGFGTTLFDPIMPVRFLSDPALELVKKET